MNIKNLLLKTLLTSAACSLSVSALANEMPFKVAIIKDYHGSKDIISGDFNKGIQSLTKKTSRLSRFEMNMGLCVAYIKTSDTENSESACTSAIDNSDSLATGHKKANYLRSVSYSNRGVSRYLSHDVSGSMEDFKAAVLIDENAITKSNLKFAKQFYAVSKDIHSVALSD